MDEREKLQTALIDSYNFYKEELLRFHESEHGTSAIIHNDHQTKFHLIDRMKTIADFLKDANFPHPEKSVTLPPNEEPPPAE